MNCILIFTDSRGKGLRAHLSNYTEDLSIQIFTLTISGRTLRSCLKSASEYLNGKLYRGTYTVKYVAIISGICDLTSIVKEGGNRILQYQHDEENVNSLINEIKRHYTIYGGKINIATIAPASIENHYSFYNPLMPRPESLEEDQKSLLQATSLINTTIIDCNKANGTESLDLARKTYSASKKARGNKTFKFSPKTLSDGVHANENIQNKWLTLASNVIQREAKRVILDIVGQRPRPQEDESTSSESDSDSQQSRKRPRRF